MEQPMLPIRRHILVALLVNIAIFASLVFVVSPLIVNLASPAVRQARLNYLWVTPPLMATLVFLVWRYLAPIARLQSSLQPGHRVPHALVRQARRRAFNAPAYLFVVLASAVLATTLLANVLGLATIPRNEIVPYLSESLLTIAATVSAGVLLALVARLRLRPILVATARLMPQAADPPPEEGQRFDVRTRLLIVILALSVVAGYFPSILAINLALRTESEFLIRQTIFLLLAIGLAVLGITPLFAFAVTGDLTADLHRVTLRLLDIARRGNADQRLHVLSLDEIGDLVQAFNEVQAHVRTQQKTLQQEYRRLLALQSVSSQISAIYDLDQLLDELVRSAHDTFGYYNSVAFLVDEQTGTLSLVASGRLADTRPDGYCPKPELTAEQRKTLDAGKALLVTDVVQCSFYTASDPNVRAAVLTPMFVGGRYVGLFAVESDRHDAFGDQDLRLIASLANQAAASIEAARLLHKSRANANALARWARNLMVVNRIAAALTSSLDAHQILSITVQHLMELTGADYGCALMLEQGGARSSITAEYPPDPPLDFRPLLQTLPDIQRTLQTGKACAVQASDHPRLLETLGENHPQIDFHALLLIPLVAPAEIIGYLLVAGINHPLTPSAEETDLCQTVAGQAAVAVANARLLKDIRQQQYALTVKSEELFAESNRLDAIINNVTDGLVVADPAGRIILSNPAFNEMAGFSPAQSLESRLLAEVLSVESLPDLVQQAVDTPDQAFDLEVELPGGQVLKTTASALCLPPSVGRPKREDQVAGVVAILRDITHEVEIDRAKTHFISAVAHELRTPLTSILGFASLIQRDLRRRIIPQISTNAKRGQATQRILENLSIIEAESQRITRLVNDMLDIAKIEAGRMEWRSENIDLPGIIEQAVTATAALARQKHLPVHVHLHEGGLPNVQAERDRLAQVMTNLLANAIKFTREGRIDVRGWRLEIEEESLRASGPIPPLYAPSPPRDAMPDLTATSDEWIIVSVTDTGVGIRPEDIPHIFEKFRRVSDPAVDYGEGTGLGLAIAKEIIEHYEGYIWVESEQGKGSMFSFALPVAHSAEGQTSR